MVEPRRGAGRVLDLELDELLVGEVRVDHDLLALIGELLERGAVRHLRSAVLRPQLLGRRRPVVTFAALAPIAATEAARQAAAALLALALELPARQHVVVVTVQPVERPRRVRDLVLEQLAVAVLVEGAHRRVAAEHPPGSTGRAAEAAASVVRSQLVARDVAVAVAVERQQRPHRLVHLLARDLTVPVDVEGLEDQRRRRTASAAATLSRSERSGERRGEQNRRIETKVQHRVRGERAAPS